MQQQSKEYWLRGVEGFTFVYSNGTSPKLERKLQWIVLEKIGGQLYLLNGTIFCMTRSGPYSYAVTTVYPR